LRLFSFLRRHHPERYEQLPTSDWAAVSSRRPALRALEEDDASTLRKLAAWFLDVKVIDPMEGAVLSSVDKATIATLACLPVLKLGTAWYNDWSTVIVAPDAFVHELSDIDEAGVVPEYADELSGRVTELGPVLLSLPDIRTSGLGDGYNVVIHEMAHKLDGRNGVVDGCPPLPKTIAKSEWRSVFRAAYTDLRERANAIDRKRRWSRGARLPLDAYAAEHPSEFFAVACEYFFDAPLRLERAYPEVYALLSRFFAG